MELKHLRNFSAVATEQHMRKAAERLHLAQPALTRQISDLEEELGCKLFDRLPRGIRLNPAGTQFLEDVTKILASVDVATKNALRASRGEVGSLRLGFTEPASWIGAFPLTVHQYRTRFPLVTLQLLPMYSGEQLQAIQTETIDGGFCYTFEEVPAGCSSIHLRSDSILLAVPRRYGWRRRKDIRLANLSDEPFVWLQRAKAPRYFDVLLRTINDGGLSPRVVQEAIDESTLLSLIAAGMGLGFVNSANIGRQPQSVDFVPVKDLNLELPLHFAWKTSNTSAALRQFRRVVERQTKAQ